MWTKTWSTTTKTITCCWPHGFHRLLDSGSWSEEKQSVGQHSLQLLLCTRLPPLHSDKSRRCRRWRGSSNCHQLTGWRVSLAGFWIGGMSRSEWPGWKASDTEASLLRSNEHRLLQDRTFQSKYKWEEVMVLSKALCFQLCWQHSSMEGNISLSVSLPPWSGLKYLNNYQQHYHSTSYERSCTQQLLDGLWWKVVLDLQHEL